MAGAAVRAFVPASRPLTRGQRLRHLADELDTLADAIDLPSRSFDRSDRLTAEAERIASAVRAEFRGAPA